MCHRRYLPARPAAAGRAYRSAVGRRRFVPLRPRWVVADVAKREFTLASHGQQVRRVALLKRGGYQVVFSRDRYLVLHGGDARQAAR